MPDPEYPRFDDPRLRWGMPGLRYGRPLPSYITNPPNLNHPKGTIHSMQLPENLDDLETLGFNAADGAEQLQDTLGLLQNRNPVILSDAQAFSDARLAFDGADKKVRDAYRDLRIARDNARAWLMTAKQLLIPTLGKKPSAAWTEAGFSDQTLAVPNGEDKLMPMLRAQKKYLTEHPTLAVPDDRYKYTAARAQALLDALDAAVTDDTTGVKPTIVKKDGALNTRNLTEEALRRRLHGLHGELEQKLDALDPRWITFGFKPPGAQDRPDGVTTLTVQSLGSRRYKLSWTAAARSARYQLWEKAPGASEFTLLDRTDGELEKLLENVTAGLHTYKVRGVNDSGEGHFSNTVTVTET
ncbi:MAG: fibronectin type III domain-containing protein [Verrucomicrobia bacterium]|nr:fibronectin type III domain-containing protein [Verrucomicrobiota bacterium]